MRFALALLAAVATLAMIALPPDRVSLRLATGRRYARVTVVVQPSPEHRALMVSGVVVDDEGLPIWERTSGVQLDGDRSRRQWIFEWPGPPSGLLRARADVVGLCGSAQGAAFVGFGE